MKFSLALVSLVISSSVFANAPTPLLKYEIHSGFVPAPLVYTKTCVVSRNANVTITLKKANQNPVTTSHRLQFTPPFHTVHDIARSVEAAARGPIVKSGAPTDGPSFQYQGFGRNGSVQLKQYYSAVSIDNRSPEAQNLVSLLDLNCK